MFDFDQIVTTLVNRLEITSGQRGVHWAEDPAYKAVLGALVGQAKTAVTVVDTPNTSHRWVVLGAVNDADNQPRLPRLVKAHLHKGADPTRNWLCICSDVLPRLQGLGWLGREDQLSTGEVAGWFTGRCAGLGDDAKGLPATWVPAAIESYAPVTIGGDHGERRRTTNDVRWESNYYEWFNLADVPVGGSVYRLSSKNTLWVFTRREADRWEVTVVPNISWATTSHHDGGKDFGTLLDGALEAYRILQPVTA